MIQVGVRAFGKRVKRTVLVGVAGLEPATGAAYKTAALTV